MPIALHSRAPTSRILLLALLAACALLGCAAAPSAERDYERLVRDLRTGRSDAWADLRDAIRQRSDLATRLDRLDNLALSAANIDPTDYAYSAQQAEAMLDQYYGDLAAHEMRQRVALAQGDGDLADFHLRAREALAAGIAASGTGTGDDPFDVLTGTQARAWLRMRGDDVVGGVLLGDDDADTLVLALKIKGRDDEPLLDQYFDLTGTYRARADQALTMGGARPEPSDLIARLAEAGDDTAQTAYAMDQWQTGPDAAAEALNWLRRASEADNVVAQETLGVIYGSLARSRQDDAGDRLLELAVDQFLLAIAQGSATAMHNLARLYLSGHYGEENQPAGVALLRQAAERDNLESIVLLARLKYYGQFTPRDLDGALTLLREASARGNHEAQLLYAQHQLGNDDGAGFDAEALGWLREAAGPGSLPEAMLLLGAVLVDGRHVERDPEQAMAWFKRAGDAADDTDTINGVVWTLTVAAQTDIRDPAWALQRMDAMMTRDSAARRNPAYLDTWAATHAANGNFERAVEIQQQAVAEARMGDDPDTLRVLEEHLELFEAGGTVTERMFASDADEQDSDAP